MNAKRMDGKLTAICHDFVCHPNVRSFVVVKGKNVRNPILNAFFSSPVATFNMLKMLLNAIGIAGT